MKVVYRNPEGISLNGREYLLDKENNLLVFADEEEALSFLKSKGIEGDLEDSGIYLADINFAGEIEN